MAAHTPFSSFADLSVFLEQRGFFRIKPGLERIRAALPALGLENPAYTSVQVIGTNGKGSTSTFLAALLQAHGHMTGLFTSPHLVSIRERVRINGAMLPEDEWTALANEIFSAAPDLTYFEFTTVMAALAFARHGVTFAVIEAGLGGTWDATTALRADLTLFTPIGLDHCRLLGDTIPAITRDKAGAIRPTVPVISAVQCPEALETLQAAAAAAHSDLAVARPEDVLPSAVRDGSLTLGLRGAHQPVNASLALAAWRHLANRLGLAREERLENQALQSAFIPGRLHFIPAGGKGLPAPMLVDGAHNVHGMAALGKALAQMETAPGAIIFSCLADKSPDSLIPHLRVMSTGPIFVPPIKGNPRASDAVELAEKIGLGAYPVSSLSQALAMAHESVMQRLGPEVTAHPLRFPVLLCGSLYLVGEFFSLYPKYLSPEAKE